MNGGQAQMRQLRDARFGFLWQAHFWTDFNHPAGYRYGGYTKSFRAWTKVGAMRIAERHRHQKWAFDVRRASKPASHASMSQE